VREAVGLTQGEVAARLGVKRQSLAQFENAEEQGSISIASMRRAAEAMDCELVCFLVPRESLAGSFTELAQMHDPASKHLQATEHSMRLKGHGAPTDGR
jgi:predicted DNA-binding mobile mystery protein A